MLRFLPPFLFGILFYLYFQNIQSSYLLLLFGTMLFLYIALIFKFNTKRKFFISVIADIILFLVGYQTTFYQDAENYAAYLGKHITEQKERLLVETCQIPVYKNKYVKLPLKVIGVFQNDSFVQTRGDILINIDSATWHQVHFKENAYYTLKITLHNPRKNQNPYGFDYAAYLKRQNIYFTGYLNNINHFKYVDDKKHLSLSEYSIQLKYKIIQQFKENNHLDTISKNISLALLTGFDDEIDAEIINQFSYSGTLHILSVSGFHTGLLFLLISFIFSVIDPYKKWRWIRVVLTICILFFYALLAGLAPPIIRAAVMLSLLVIHQNFYLDRNLHPLNTLSVAVFIILITNPFYINDIGFLLSFSAMVGIIYFSPKLIFEHAYFQKTWNLLSMSIGAQIGTLPFALYYFHSFSFFFWLANLIIIPLSSVVMIVAALNIFKVSVFAFLLNFLIHSMIWINALFAKNYTYYNFIHFTIVDAVALLLLIFGTRILIEKSKIISINYAVSILIIWIAAHRIYKEMQPKHYIEVYTDKKHTIAYAVNNNIATFSLYNDSDFKYWIKNYLLTGCFERYRSYLWNVAYYKDKTVLFVYTYADTLLIKTIRPNKIIFCADIAVSSPLLKYDALNEILLTENIKTYNRNLFYKTIDRKRVRVTEINQTVPYRLYFQ